MMRLTKTALKMMMALAVCAGVAEAGGWPEAVEVRYETTLCISYRARLAGGFLVVQATHQPGWHTYAMDNRQRAEEKLAGQESLGMEAPTEIKVTQGLAVTGPWYQSPPKDLSKPELRWFTWGFDGDAMFVAKVRRSGAGPARIAVRGQACNANLCKQINIVLALPPAGASKDVQPPAIDFNNLVRVRSRKAAKAQRKET